jgi:hypothetical protein
MLIWTFVYHDLQKLPPGNGDHLKLTLQPHALTTQTSAFTASKNQIQCFLPIQGRADLEHFTLIETPEFFLSSS